MLQLFISIVNMSISAVILLFLVCIGRFLLRKYSAAEFRYLLWIPFLMRLLVPYSLPSIFSIYNLMHQKVDRPNNTLLAITYFDPSLPETQVLETDRTGMYKQVLFFACIVWAIGAIIMLFCFFVQYWQLRKHLATAKLLYGEDYNTLATIAKLRKTPPILSTNAVQGPLVFGILHPRVVLPASLNDMSSEQRYIILHEFSHIRCWDYGILLLSFIALSLHWFNPLIWFARKLLTRDIECACDQRVLSRIDPEEQLSYAQALIDWAGKQKLSLSSYAAFGEQDITRRIKEIVAWKRLPLGITLLFDFLILAVFLCTATNPIIPPYTYIPISSPFVSSEQKERFEQSSYQLKSALENGDYTNLTELASMDALYFAPLYQNLKELELTVTSMRLYFNSNTSAEVYMNVTVANGAGFFSEGSGTLVAHLKQTDYRQDPFVDCLMSVNKYESIQLSSNDSEATRLAKRMCTYLTQTSFEANTLSPITVANVCMASAIEDKGYTSPFSSETMRELAKEYFDLDDFSCFDASVYDSANDCYFYTPPPQQQLLVTHFESMDNGQVTVTVEKYDDPLCLYPLQKLECIMQKID